LPFTEPRQLRSKSVRNNALRHSVCSKIPDKPASAGHLIASASALSGAIAVALSNWSIAMVQSTEHTSGNPLTSEGLQADEIQIAAVQEELEVGVKTTETGAVRIHKIVHEEMQPVPVSLRSQTVEVKRFTVNRPVEEKFEARQEGDTLIIPVFEYVPIITMQLTLKEEVHVTTTESRQEVFQNVLLNTEELVVERRTGTQGEWRREDDDPV
jgi:stress response protein YsnF